MATILQVVGARPNYVKVAPVWKALARRLPHVTQQLVDTGQHYDDAMARGFARELGLPAPDWSLGVGSGPRLAQIEKVAAAFDGVCRRVRPDLVIVVGDVNSTLGAAQAAVSLDVRVAHVEAGLRSGDLTMPEELNRIATDRIADVLFTPSLDANDNLAREGIPAARVHFVGNVMIDTLFAHRAEASFECVRSRFPVEPGAYAVCTVHRPSNVDTPDALAAMLDAIAAIGRRMPVVFPLHPRTRRRIDEFALGSRLGGLLVSDPLGYVDFLSLLSHARLVLTDSGGLQEESVFLGVPCVTMRSRTERPVTLSAGTNRLVGPDAASILDGVESALAGAVPPCRPDLWDGHAADRIVDLLRTAIPTLSASPDRAATIARP